MHRFNWLTPYCQGARINSGQKALKRLNDSTWLLSDIYVCKSWSPHSKMVTPIYQSIVCRLPVTMDPECAKTLSNGLTRSNGTWLVSTNQRSPRRDVIMARWKPPVLVNYGAGPFNFTISHNSSNIKPITSVLGLIDGKICALYIDSSAFTLHWVLWKSHSIPNPKLGCARYRAKSFTSVLKCPSAARSVSYCAHMDLSVTAHT